METTDTLDMETPEDTETLPLFSADSHVIEDPELWSGILAPGVFSADDAAAFHQRRGGVDAKGRIEAMEQDGVRGEVLYPSLGLKLFGLEDPSLQRRAFRRYNEWLSDFCSAEPNRLLGVGLVPCYDIADAVTEVEWCADHGMRGCMIWQVPPPSLPFAGDYYEPLWEAASDRGLPVSMHILTGHNYSNPFAPPVPEEPDPHLWAIRRYRGSVNLKLLSVCDAVLELVLSGTYERHPRLKMVLVENEIGWIPFFFDQLDYYRNRFLATRPTRLQGQPSEVFGRQLFATFFRDPVGARMLEWFGVGACMWSNDFPHPNSTWPNSRKVVAEQLKGLSADARREVMRDTAMRLYGVTPV